jgi:hypothetical protein
MASLSQTNISISEMLSNPTGKGSAFFASRARIKQQLDTIFIKNLRKYRREFYCVPYVDEFGLSGRPHNLIFYVSVPSEAFYMNHIRWDCVIMVEYDASKAIQYRNAKFYTNSPSFIYTYAYVFNQEGLLPPFIKQKMPTECLNNAPTIRNPIESRGFDKILYQALKYLIDGNCLTDQYINSYQQRWNSITMSQLLVRVADTANLVAVYQHAKTMEALKQKRNRKTITTKQLSDMENERKKYDAFKKANTPGYVGFIIRRAPRSKITARKAIKAIAKIKPKAKKSSTF